jgi:hypothetical protein
MQKSCEINQLKDPLQLQIVTIIVLKRYSESCKRIQPAWEINFHFLVRISIRFAGEIERKETTIDMCVSRRGIRKVPLKNKG